MPLTCSQGLSSALYLGSVAAHKLQGITDARECVKLMDINRSHWRVPRAQRGKFTFFMADSFSCHENAVPAKRQNLYFLPFNFL